MYIYVYTNMLCSTRLCYIILYHIILQDTLILCMASYIIVYLSPARLPFEARRRGAGCAGVKRGAQNGEATSRNMLRGRMLDTDFALALETVEGRAAASERLDVDAGFEVEASTPCILLRGTSPSEREFPLWSLKLSKV